MLRFCLLGSGSSGNATLIDVDGHKILIDNGLSYRQLESRTVAAGMSLEGLKAVFITHEHADHVGGLGVLTRKLDVPVYMTRATHDALPKTIGKLNSINYFEAGEEVSVNGARVGSFSVSHDAADPVSFVVEAKGTKLGIAADLGRPTELVRQRLIGSHGLILESNYCPDMLSKGSYPPMIQQRIRGRHGHLSNHDMCSLLAHIMHDALRVVVLVHISRENNTHERAHLIASQTMRGHAAALHVAGQDSPTPVFEIRA
ncbi:MAG: MBL fold metallo-hydrolase [Candidatus Hydrogenedentes bacterium]|nr:MBL fold metallo-hydrolase [Candidatus Hydrogenedentota bacterium]